MSYARKAVALAVVSLFAGLALASDPPDAAINPQTGHIEVVDAAFESGNYNVRHVENPGAGQPLLVTNISVNASDDLGARIAIGPAGGTWVVWFRDGALQILWVCDWDIRDKQAQPASDGTVRIHSNLILSSREAYLHLRGGNRAESGIRVDDLTIVADRHVGDAVYVHRSDIDGRRPIGRNAEYISVGHLGVIRHEEHGCLEL